MRRIRLGTLMLLVIIAALSIALVVQHREAARREAELRSPAAAMGRYKASMSHIVPD